jgi:hypothetical protein
MTKMLLTSFLLAALGIASAKTYDVSFNQAVTVAGTELKAGGYRLDLDGDKVVITNGKQSVESPVKVEQGDKKFGLTSVQLSNAANGKMLVQEIDLGGTKTKLVFSD